MAPELHIQLHADVVDSLEELFQNFPFEPGQRLLAMRGGLVIIDLGEADDSTYVQDWYLNSHDAVFSYYVVDE